MKGLNGSHSTSVIVEQALNQLVAADLEMHGDVRENRGERPYAERGVIGNGNVVLAPLVRGEANMAAGLARSGLTEGLQRASKVRPRQTAWQPHTAMSSSRTK